MFELASKKKIRFASSRGNITVEDLWDLSLEQLDTIAMALNKRVKESAEESFITKSPKADKTLMLSLEIVKSVIETKMEQADKRRKAQENKAKIDKYLELISQKQDEALTKKSLATLQKELAGISEAEAEEE